jgi:hypothetical protein
MLDYVLRRLWVQWFQYFGGRPVVWKDHHLDCVRFAPMASEGVFGFVDPRDMLWGSHIMPDLQKEKFIQIALLSHLANGAPCSISKT